MLATAEFAIIRLPFWYITKNTLEQNIQKLRLVFCMDVKNSLILDILKILQF